MCFGSVVARKQSFVWVVLAGWGGKQSSSLSWLSGRAFLVLRVFLFWASRCPMAVASNAGGKRVSVALASPGNGGRNPLRSAIQSVEMAGENRAACAKATK